MQAFDVRSERVYSAHHTFLRIARQALIQAEIPVAWRDNAFLAITLSALSIEGFCNGLGALDIERWERDFESCSPRAKLRLLCMEFDLEFNPDVQPWADALWLIKIRNRIAHPKLEPINIVARVSTQAEANAKHREMPLSKIEQECTVENARRALNAVDALIAYFADKAPNGLDLRFDSWSASTHEQFVGA